METRVGALLSNKISVGHINKLIDTLDGATDKNIVNKIFLFYWR